MYCFLLIFASLIIYLHTQNRAQNYKKVMETKSVRNKIATMSLGDSLTFSLKEVGYSTLRTYGYTIGVDKGYTYSTRVNRKERLLTITRTA